MKNSRLMSTADVTHISRNRTAALHESIFHCKNCMCSVNLTCTLKISLSKCLILAMIDVLPGGLGWGCDRSNIQYSSTTPASSTCLAMVG